MENPELPRPSGGDNFTLLKKLLLSAAIVANAACSEPGERFRTEANGESFLLRDSVTHASARIVAGKCMSLILPDSSGDPNELLGRFGVPVLFPWPGRIPQGKYQFGGVTHQFTRNGRAKTAMHGFVGGCSWRFEKPVGGSKLAKVTAVASSADCPNEAFPFPWELRLTYELSPNKFRIIADVKNPGSNQLPFGLGFHPYFRTPWIRNGPASSCLVQIPAEKYWNLAPIDNLRLETTNSAELSSSTWNTTVSGTLDVRRPGPVANQPSVVYTGTQKDGGGVSTCRIFDPESQEAISISFTSGFESVVLFKPRKDNELCIEPWTCPPNAFNLAAAGVPENGLIVLNPGETWTGAVEITTEATRK